MRRRACGGVRQGDFCGVSPRFFGVPAQRHSRSGWPVCCSYGSSSDGDGTAAADFDASGEEFVDSSVMEAGKFACEITRTADLGFEFE
jgi:hypothetical protein